MTRIARRPPPSIATTAQGGVEILELPLEPTDRARAALEAGGSPRAMIEAFERGGALPSRVIEAQARELPPASDPTPLETEHRLLRTGAGLLLGFGRSTPAEPLPREGQPPVFEATIALEDLARNGDTVDRTYRWQVTEGGNGPRVVAQWLRPDGGWSLVRRPETCARLLTMTPAGEARR